MNVLIINASPRKNGVASTLLAEVVSAISPAHHIEVVRIHDLSMKPCNGCLQCRPDRTCVLPRDDAHILADNIRQADFLIIGSPVYWGNMPGTLKIFFDRNGPCSSTARPRPSITFQGRSLEAKRPYSLSAAVARYLTASCHRRAGEQYGH